MKAELDGQIYDESDARAWSVDIGNKVREAVTGDFNLFDNTECIVNHSIFVSAKLNIPRYKLVIQTTIGQMRDQGLRVASRCLWDITVDNYSAVNYTNVSQRCRYLFRQINVYV